MPEERRYTLAEAKRVLAKQECDRDGHDVTATVIQGDDRAIRHYIACHRCYAEFVPKED